LTKRIDYFRLTLNLLDLPTCKYPNGDPGQGEVKHMESTRRSIAKALSWRILATVITSTLVYAITGKGEFAATVGLADTTIKFFVYFAHERLWNRINYGREQKQPEYYI